MSNPRAIIAEVAAQYLGVREQRTNWSPQIEKFWQDTNYPTGAQDAQPWCAAFCCFVLDEADKQSGLLGFSKPARSPSVERWMEWARLPEVGAAVFKPGDPHYIPSPGDIVSFLPHFSHIGIVERFDPVAKIVHTIEGNTNSSGGREGDGVYRKERNYGFCGSFIRVAARAGG